MGDAEESTRQRRLLLLLYLLLFIFVETSLDTGISGPMLPLYIISLGASVSAMSTAFAAMHMVSAAIRTPVGLLSDRFDSRIFLTGGVILSVVSLLLSTTSHLGEQILLAMVLSGIAAGLFYPIEERAIAESTGVEGRSRAFALMNLTWGLVGLSTPVVGGYLVENHGMRSPFMAGFIASLLGIPLSLRMKGRTREDSIRDTFIPSDNVEMREALSPVVTLGVSRFVLTTAIALPWTLTAVYLKERCGCGYLEVGYYLTIMSLGSIAATPLAARLGTPRDRRRSILLLMPLNGLLFIGLALSRFPLQVAALIFLMNAFGGVCATSANTLAGDIVSVRRLGFAYGVNSTALRLGISAGSFLGGYFADLLGFESAFLIGTAVSFLAAIPTFTLGKFLPPTERSYKATST